MAIKNKNKIMQTICSMQWLMDPDYFSFMLDVVAHGGDLEEAASIKSSNHEIRSMMEMAVEGTDVAIIPIMGPIIPRASMFSRMCGVTDLDMVNSQFQASLKDDSVGKILFYFDTPGGHATGISEFSDIIYEARSTKPVEGYVGGTCASAGFWLGSSVSNLAVDDTARLGSVGVVVAYPKGDGTYVEITNSLSPNKRPNVETKEGKSEIVSYLDSMAEVFFEKLNRNFGIGSVDFVKENFGKGGIKVGQNAVNSKMAHEVSSLKKVVDRLAAMDTEEHSGKRKVHSVGVDLETDTSVSNSNNVTSSSDENSGGPMNEQELKEKYPDLYASVLARGKEGMVSKEELASMAAKVDEASATTKELFKANGAMAASLAGRVYEGAFAASGVPSALKAKLETCVDYTKFVDEKGSLDDKAYEKAVASELAEWSAAMPAAAAKEEREIKGKAGLSSETPAASGSEGASDEEDDATADALVGFVVKK